MERQDIVRIVQDNIKELKQMSDRNSHDHLAEWVADLIEYRMKHDLVLYKQFEREYYRNMSDEDIIEQNQELIRDLENEEQVWSISEGKWI